MNYEQGSSSSLPKLPLPELIHTLDRFLQTVLPICCEVEVEEAKRACEELLEPDGVGVAMQKALESYAQKRDSYVEEFWDDAYLKSRAPLVLNVNPIFVLEDDPTPSRNDQVARAASLVLSAIKFVQAVKQGTLAPDMMKKTSLCMSQYAYLFSSARIPVFEDEKYKHDRVVTYQNARHIVVLCRGHFYYFDVIWEDGRPAVTQREISRNLESILKDTPKTEMDKSSVSIMTSEDRETWAQTRRKLSQLKVNERVLKVIDSALFVLCLDNFEPNSADEIAANVLHGTYEIDGNGLQRGSCINRWYDKLQLIVTSTGNAGINFEHSAVDGHTVLRFASDVMSDTIVRFAQTISGGRVPSFKSGGGDASPRNRDRLFQQQQGRQPETRPRKLEFQIDEDILDCIRFAECRLSDRILQNDTRSLEFPGYGKLFIVLNEMSPDAFVQVAMLNAYFQLYGTLPNTYESVQTKHFVKGRTEAGRSATPEATEFLKAWRRDRSTKEAKKNVIDSLRKAVKAHSNVTRNASKGFGVDRHLFALQMLFRKQHPGKALPGFFECEAYKRLCDNTLSTSNCGNPSLRFFGFGPVTPQGFGIGYIIKDDAINFCVTSKHRQTLRFINTLDAYLNEVHDILKELSQSYQPKTVEISRLADDSGYGFFGDDLQELDEDDIVEIQR